MGPFYFVCVCKQSQSHREGFDIFGHDVYEGEIIIALFLFLTDGFIPI